MNITGTFLFWSVIFFYICVYVCLLLWLLRKQNRETHVNFVSQPIIGIIACMLVVPLLRRMIQSGVSPKDTVARLNEQTQNLAQCMCDNIKEPNHNERNCIILLKLVEIGGVPLSKAQVKQLYSYCMNPSHNGVLAPLEKWKFIPETQLPCSVQTTGFTLNQDTNAFLRPVKIRSKSHPQQQQHKEDDEEGKEPGSSAENINPEQEGQEVAKKVQPGPFVILPTAPPEWSAFALKDPGVYRFRTKLIGAAKAAVGNSAGQINTANVRFTTGTEMFPKVF